MKNFYGFYKNYKVWKGKIEGIRKLNQPAEAAVYVRYCEMEMTNFNF